MSKAKKMAKVYLSLAMAFFVSMFASQNIFVGAASKSYEDGGVKVTLSTDKETYDLGETAKITVKLKNENPHEVNIENLNLNYPEYFVLDSEPNFPSKLAANETFEQAVNASFTYEKWETGVFKNHRITEGSQEETLKVGILGSYRTIDPEWTFSANIIDNISTDDKVLYEKYLALIDAKDKNNAESIAFFDLKLTQGNTNHSTFKNNGYVKLYFQVPTGWDAHELQILHPETGEDEEFKEEVETLADGKKYITFTTNHFSAYALVDPGKKKETPPPTGDYSNFMVPSFLALAVAALVLSVICNKKYRKAMMALALCFTLGTQLAPSAMFKSLPTNAVESSSENGSELEPLLDSTVSVDVAINDIDKDLGTIARNEKISLDVLVTYDVPGNNPGGPGGPGGSEDDVI